MSWLLLNSVLSKIFSGLWDMWFGHYLATKNLNVAFCLLFLMLPNFRHAQKAKFHVTELSIFTFYFPFSCYIIFLFPPPFFFLFLGIYYASLLKEKFSWKPGELWNNFTIHIYYLKGGRDGVEWSKTLIGIFCSTLHVFFFLAFCRTCLTELCSFVYTCRWKDDSFTN